MALTYKQAKSEFKRAQSKRLGKSLDSRTKLIKNNDNTYSVLFNGKKFLTIRPDNKWVVNAISRGDEYGITDRINKYTPATGYGRAVLPNGQVGPKYFVGAVIKDNGRYSKSSLRNAKGSISVFGKAGSTKQNQQTINISQNNAADWLKKHRGVAVKVDPKTALWLKKRDNDVSYSADGKSVKLKKIVNSNFASESIAPGGRKVFYKPGTAVTDAHYVANHSCGGGLHLCPTFAECKNYAYGSTKIEVWADLATLRMISNDKAKTKTVTVI